MRKHNITYDPYYKGLRIQAGPGMGCHMEILDRLYTLLKKMESTYSRILVSRYDVHFPPELQYSPNDDSFKLFIQDFKRYLKDKGIISKTVWCREHTESSRNHHYHCVTIMAGNRTRSAYGHMLKANEYWLRKLKLSANRQLIHVCGDRNGYLLERGSPDFETVFYWISYLSKVKTKENTPLEARAWGSSRLG